MLLRNTFTVPVPVDRAWQVLLDAGRVAPCLPGAGVDRVDGNNVRGRLAARFGAVDVHYQGTLTVVERDEGAHRAVLHVAASESRGGGTARATIATSLAPDGDRTSVTVVTDLAVTGKPAQLGRGLVADVSRHLVGQFARNLAAEIEAGRLAVPAAPVDRAAPVVEPTATGAAGASAGTSGRGFRLVAAARPMAAPFVVGVVVGWLLGRR